jgi:hypothetical protein
MIVLIPSYRRTDILPWVLQSVTRSDTAGIQERILILIVNNYPPNRAVVDQIVAHYTFAEPFQCQVVHRERTLAAVDSWFLALAATAMEDEVVVLLGDDDLLLPWGLTSRHRAIVAAQADMLLSDFIQRIYFFRQGTRCWFAGQLPDKPRCNSPAVPWDYLPAPHPEASFISNHCYRYTAAFRRGLELARKWCDAQEWVPVEFGTANLPFYLAYALRASGARVFALRQTCVFRGSVAEEAMFQDYSDGGNTAFFSLCIYNTFSNPQLHDDLSQFGALRSRYKNAFVQNALSILLNRKISKPVLWETMTRSMVTVSDFFARKALLNVLGFLKQIPGLRGFRLRRKLADPGLMTTKEFLERLGEQRTARISG